MTEKISTAEARRKLNLSSSPSLPVWPAKEDSLMWDGENNTSPKSLPVGPLAVDLAVRQDPSKALKLIRILLKDGLTASKFLWRAALVILLCPLVIIVWIGSGNGTWSEAAAWSYEAPARFVKFIYSPFYTYIASVKRRLNEPE